MLRTLFLLGVLAAARRVRVLAPARRARRPLRASRPPSVLRAARGVPRRGRDGPHAGRDALRALGEGRPRSPAVGGAAAALAPTVPRCSRSRAPARSRSPRRRSRDTRSTAAQPRWLVVPVDLVHLGSAAVWLGGLRRCWPSCGERSGTGRAPCCRAAVLVVALVAVLVLGASGFGRSLSELDSVSQVWSTSYGRALLVKTALFLPLLGVGWLNRGCWRAEPASPAAPGAARARGARRDRRRRRRADRLRPGASRRGRPPKPALRSPAASAAGYSRGGRGVPHCRG